MTLNDFCKQSIIKSGEKSANYYLRTLNEHLMGLLKILAISAAGVWSARALFRLNAKVARIAVPSLSSLARKANECGDFYADTFIVELPKRIAYSGVPVTVQDVTKSFFNSKVFSNFEGPLLRLIFSLKKPELGKSEFYLGEKILLWKVCYRSNDEILLEWQSGNFRGLTWFHVNKNQVLMFGSSIGHLKYSHRTRQNWNYSAVESVVGAFRLLKDNPYEQGIFVRIQTLFLRLAGAFVVGGHQFYSRLLLVSTLKTLVLEEGE